LEVKLWGMICKTGRF